MKLFSKNFQETFQIFRNTDWSKHELGPTHTWPEQLINFLNFIYNSKQACFIFWSEKAFCFYNDSFKGSWGIGLTLVKEYAEAHGGSTNVTSSIDGTTFSILIPQDSRKINARSK